MNELNRQIQNTLPRPFVDVFKLHHHPYYIATFGYRQESVGFRVLYYLCHVLNECGYEAYIIDKKPVPGLRIPILTDEIIKRHIEEGRNSIAVYNEAFKGNPLNGDVVVRWIMNKMGYDDNKVIEYPQTDLLYHWSKFYAKDIHEVNLLNIPVIDRGIFNTNSANSEDRMGFCYYAHKYLKYKNGQIRLPEEMTENGTSLCQDIGRTHEEIAEILRHSKVLYSFEPSALVTEAALCGCPAVYIKTDYFDDFNLDDIADVAIFDVNNIDYNYLPDPEPLQEHYEQTERKAWELVGAFIKETQSIAESKGVNTNKKNTFLDFCKEHGEKLYIYGVGDVSWNCHRLMDMWNIDVKGFIISDDYAKPNVSMHLELPVYHLSEIESEKESCGLILAMIVTNQYDVMKTLVERGFINCFFY